MSIYLLKNVYFYNIFIHYLNFFGWFFSAWISLCILLKTVFQIECITTLIIIGWIIITFSLHKTYKGNENSLSLLCPYFLILIFYNIIYYIYINN